MFAGEVFNNSLIIIDVFSNKIDAVSVEKEYCSRRK